MGNSKANKNIDLDDFFQIQLKCKDAIFSHCTSAFLNDLTTRDPLVVEFAVPNGCRVGKSVTHLNFEVYYFAKDNYELGKTATQTIFGNTVYIYNAERTLCDLFSADYLGDVYVIYESLENYLASPQKDLKKLFEYAKILGVEDILREKIKEFDT